MMFNAIRHSPILQLFGLIVLSAIFFGSTNTDEVSSIILFVGYLLLVLTIYYIFYNLIKFVQLYGVKVKHKRQMALYMTIVIGIIIALQSTGELGAHDIWVLLPLVILGYFYSTYARSNSL